MIKINRSLFKKYVEKDIIPDKCSGGPWGCEACGIEKPLPLNSHQWI